MPETVPAWKQEVNARLSAHRMRRGASDVQQPALPGMESDAAPAARAARVAARVAERYAKVPTYSELLAAEAANAARAAEAAAQAALEAHEAAQAVTDVLLAGLDMDQSATGDSHAASRIEFAPEPIPEPVHYRVDPASLPAARRNQLSQSGQPQSGSRSTVDPHPHIVDPFEEALVAPAQALPARVLEFPRELVAARKARPRLAEGPLLEPGAAPEKTQLRIFEVEPEAISHEPVAPVQALLPDSALGEAPLVSGWSSIRLDAIPRYAAVGAPEMADESMVDESMADEFMADESMRSTPRRTRSQGTPFSSRAAREGAPSGNAHKRKHAQSRSSLVDMVPLHVAPLGDRLMAVLVDAALVLFAFLLFALVFAACTAHPPTGKPAMVAAGSALVGFFALYQWLFFTYAERTPGMHFAKIALCTFEDENPVRKTLQQRVGAFFLAALPLGLGFLWALLDDDRLGWHDRMTRTYQRSYR